MANNTHFTKEEMADLARARAPAKQKDGQKPVSPPAADPNRRRSERTMLVVSNYWHKPNIRAIVTFDTETAPAGSIHLELEFSEFVKALKSELPHPVKTLTRKRLGAEIEGACERIIEKVKMASVEPVTEFVLKSKGAAS